ncbi:hypothetical protein BCR37DRAFT_381399 [Protomyces lactucae-debilis]|uniref:Uncharacterized protein n=1 Tax=Protomyces lactucae-debilis TaxID=2754530 RepID=A0A1Y2F7V8_PROLT|nr:uncharacterized protein BCR37DRAFT_381399 [Protomyces lactucae-debilis]ORY79971.1 hypothetical protein BCR37DRAFT_381399 [Protomyces lactucae-debilis]
MVCCGSSQWKREEKVDHRFDFIDICDFHTGSFGARIGYLAIWFGIIRSFAILGLDIYTAIGLLILNTNAQAVAQQTFIAHDITKWIFSGCIILSVVLLIWDWIVAIRIIRSRNISFAFTNLIANRWYSVKGYDYHCLFHKLSATDQKSDSMAFWVFFSFIGWKRLILSEGPRQAINAMTVFSVLSTRNFSFKPEAYENITYFQWTVLGFMALSLIIWLFSFVRFCLAALLFFPILCHIRGGLTEFVVRRIDKRIERIMEKARRKRLDRYARTRAEENGSIRSGKVGNKKDLARSKSLLREKPTLPQLMNDMEKGPQTPLPVAMSRSTSESGSLASSASSTKKDAYRPSPPPLVRDDSLPMYRPQQSGGPGDAYPMRPMDHAQPRFAPAHAYAQPQNTHPAFRGPPPGARPGNMRAPTYHRQASYEAPLAAITSPALQHEPRQQQSWQSRSQPQLRQASLQQQQQQPRMPAGPYPVMSRSASHPALRDDAGFPGQTRRPSYGSRPMPSQQPMQGRGPYPPLGNARPHY